MNRYLIVVAAVLLTACSGGADPGDTGDALVGDTAADVEQPDDALPETMADIAADTMTDTAADTMTDTHPDMTTDESPLDVPADLPPPEPVSYAGITAGQDGRILKLANGLVEVAFDLDNGVYDVVSKAGPIRITGAEARLVADNGDTGTILGTMGRKATWAAVPVDDRLGSGVDVTLSILRQADDQPEIDLTLGLRGSGTFVTAKMAVRWDADENCHAKFMSPLVADERTGGAMFIGANPAMHTVLDNGSDVYFDYQSRIFRMGYGDSFLFQPGTVSNWNIAVKDPEGPDSLVAGWLSNEKSIGMVRVNYSPKFSIEQDGRKSFTTVEGFGFYDPPKPLTTTDPAARGPAPGLTGETFYIDVAPATPQEGLEDWATRLAAFANKAVWQNVPSGWNSWGGGGSSGGYSQDIYASRIIDNFNAMVSDFAPYGQEYFLIDDGWQQDHGDWITNKTKFPDQAGQDFMPWLAQQARENGLIPGLWIAPFWVKKSSDLYAAHPDWFADINDYGNLLVRPADNAVLDLTHPEVLAFLHDLFARITQEWGYKWLKMDFTYYALFTKNLHDPTVTASEAYRNAMRVIRDAAGQDTFMLGVAAVGLALGLLDGCRTTLDNFPQWGDDKQQSIKVTLMTAAHRWYLSRAWVNHPDLLFFRSEPLGLTFQEARAWASFVAIYGGIVKIAEPYIDMHDHQDWLYTVRAMLPVYPRTARPIDLFELKFPEYWVLPVERGSQTWNVVGLFNWGLNEDVVASAPIAEAPREKTLRWSDLGLEPDAEVLLFNGWDRTCEWATGPEWSMTAQPRTAAILVVREHADVPHVVFTTRHLLGGAVEISNEQVNYDDASLDFDIESPSGQEVTAYIFSPVAPTTITAPAEATIAPGPCENVWAVTFTPAADTTNVQIEFI
ncbi:MAG TPA: alpha-galactosidase [Myxococcota bacterium]|nr:alpha-galactosidase [Myxococcota bacterium]HOH77431.1 alpha-galactosidase [Myxococcota bacterium]